MRFLFFFTLVFSLASSACSGGSGTTIASTSGGTSPSADLGGTWTGTWYSSNGVGGNTTSTFTQTGSSLSGEVRFTNSPCFSGGTFEGTVDGDALTGAVTAGAIVVRLSGTVTSSSVDGTYVTVQAGACTGDTGTFAMSR